MSIQNILGRTVFYGMEATTVVVFNSSFIDGPPSSFRSWIISEKVAQRVSSCKGHFIHICLLDKFPEKGLCGQRVNVFITDRFCPTALHRGGAILRGQPVAHASLQPLASNLLCCGNQ